MNRETRAANWLSAGPLSKHLESLAEAEEEPDECFIKYHGFRESPLGYCCTKSHWLAQDAVRIMLERGADPNKDARKTSFKTRLGTLITFGVASSGVSDAFALAAAHNNFNVFYMMLEHGRPPKKSKTLHPTWVFWVDRWHQRNASKLALAWVLRHPLQREDLVEPILRRLCTIPLLNWK